MGNAVWISGSKIYLVRKNAPVALRIEIGEAQLGGSSIQLEEHNEEITDEAFHQIGQEGQDLSFKTLHCLTTVRDVNEATNRTAVVYTLRGGPQEQAFPFEAEVSEKGRAIYSIRFIFIPAEAAPAVV